ncbi:pantoate--beta-alanine ligase [Pseudomonas sp. NPDC007930]|uniref:pantoate--beta-alanine ligase n=1 Tax=Pseudomonas sp. NPDC007930 TaxID=3364417 RepID=UPI0036F154EA
MITVNNVAALRAAVTQARAEGKRIGLVPTMGNLHAGHIALVHTARQHAAFVVASVFVNPLQFGPNEDLDKYPRTLAADQAQLEAAGCDLLFAPTVSEMYPDGTAVQTRVSVPELAKELCGASRPGHFDGMATVVNKLFNMAQPDVAVFGQKDYQQLAVIRAMVRDLNMPIEIIGEPTVRADDGLALSSRNGYLDATQRALAPLLQRTLQAMAEAIQGGERHYEALMTRHRQVIAGSGLRLDYLDIREASSLRPAHANDEQLVILVAAYAGNTRLIDNLVFERATVADKAQ